MFRWWNTWSVRDLGRLSVSLVAVAAIALGAYAALLTREEPTAADEMAAFKESLAEVDGVRGVIDLTPENDPRQMAGEDPGFLAAVVVHHESLQCDVPDEDCGAALEIWPDAEAAEREAYFARALADVDAAMFGSVFAYVEGRALLRISPGLDKATRDALREALD